MRKHLMTLTLLGLTAGTAVQAQGFSYGFEGDLAADGWEIQSHCEEEEGNWKQVESTPLSGVGLILPHEGEKQMLLKWNDIPQDEWLISREFVCPYVAELTFWTYIDYLSDNGDSYCVMVSEDGGTEWTELWRVRNRNLYDEMVTVNLGAYTGKKIKLAWRGECVDGLYRSWLIDNVKVYGPDKEVLLYEDFESGTLPEGWTTKDSDGDGYTWDPNFLYDHPEELQGHNGSKGMISSASWFEDVALTPKNELITPSIPRASGIRFFVKAQDKKDFSEHFALYYKVTDSDEWLMVPGSEETLTVGAEWQERSYLLPYGTEYVSFSHFDCTDQYYLCIDDVTVYGEELVGITETTASDAPAEVTGYYDLSGRRIDAPQKGVYIVKMSNGKNKKVVRK